MQRGADGPASAAPRARPGGGLRRGEPYEPREIEQRLDELMQVLARFSSLES